MSITMRAPSNRSGIPTLPIALLLAVILFLGLALAPRAFEFRAWPEPARYGAVEEIVDRPAEGVTEVPVARVKTGARKAPDALAVRGRNPRRGEPARDARARRDDGRGRSRSRSRRSGRTGRDGRGADAPAVVVEQPPAQEPAPPASAPEQPAQLAEAPQGDQVRRNDVAQLAEETLPEPLRYEDTGPPREDDFHSRGPGAGEPGSDCSD
jgi:hypothetical protein